MNTEHEETVSPHLDGTEDPDRSRPPLRTETLADVALGAAAGATVGVVGGAPGILAGAVVGAAAGGIGALTMHREHAVRATRDARREHDVRVPDLAGGKAGVRWDELVETLDSCRRESPPAHEAATLRAEFEELECARDELRVQTHLARLEAREAWEERIAPPLRRLADEGHAIGEAARATARALIHELRTLLGA